MIKSTVLVFLVQSTFTSEAVDFDIRLVSLLPVPSGIRTLSPSTKRTSFHVPPRLPFRSEISVVSKDKSLQTELKWEEGYF